jgi:hypothetical protein
LFSEHGKKQSCDSGGESESEVSDRRTWLDNLGGYDSVGDYI